MSSVLEEMRAVLEGDEDALMHYGMKYRSGRYPYGSGEDPYQHEGDFLTRIERLRKDGWKETAENVQKEFGMKLEDYRNEKYWADYTRKIEKVEQAKNLKKKGLGWTAIGREVGETESTVRSWFNPKTMNNMEASKKTADFLKQVIDEHGPTDVGKDVEKTIGVSRTRLDQAIYALESEGYIRQQNRIPQTVPGKSYY